MNNLLDLQRENKLYKEQAELFKNKYKELYFTYLAQIQIITQQRKIINSQGIKPKDYSKLLNIFFLIFIGVDLFLLWLLFKLIFKH